MRNNYFILLLVMFGCHPIIKLHTATYQTWVSGFSSGSGINYKIQLTNPTHKEFLLKSFSVNNKALEDVTVSYSGDTLFINATEHFLDPDKYLKNEKAPSILKKPEEVIIDGILGKKKITLPIDSLIQINSPKIP